MTSSTLVTERATVALSGSIDKLLENVQAHEALPIDISHLGVTVVDQPIYDNANVRFDDSPNSPYGNKVGTVTLEIRTNGVVYKIPASLSPYGVPLVGNITSQLPSEAFSLAEEGESQPPVSVGCNFTASQPTVVTFQVYLNVGGWTDMNTGFWYQNGVAYASFPSGGHAFKASSAIFTYTNADGTPGSTTVSSGDVRHTTPSYPSPTAQTVTLALAFESGDTTDKIVLGQIRLKIDNTANGGGIRYSNVCTCTLEDRTGSWIVSAMDYPWSDIDLRRMYRFRLWALKHEPRETGLYRGSLGRELVRRMKAQQANFSELQEKILAMFTSNMAMNQRFKAYRALTKECFERYWPDCPDQYVRGQLDHNDTNV